MGVVRKTAQADTDILEIATYIAQDNLDAGGRLIDEIDEKGRLLSQNPALGRKRFDLAPSLRSFPAGNDLFSTARSRMESRSFACCTEPETSRDYSIEGPISPKTEVQKTCHPSRIAGARRSRRFTVGMVWCVFEPLAR
jgi:toxin ParE1/3/4